jgi:hypothetical protein
MAEFIVPEGALVCEYFWPIDENKNALTKTDAKGNWS